MIRHSFIFLERVGNAREQSLWKQGILHWDDFCKAEKVKGMSASVKAYYNRKIVEAQSALQKGEAQFFVDKLPGTAMWRLYLELKEECCFLDVETDSSGRLTVVGVSNYYRTVHFVRGFNLEKKEVQRELQKYKMAVTFNGAAFDLPKLKKFGVEIRVPHLDLKPLCVNVGLKGGLKEVERILNVKRPEHLQGNPVELWKAFHASGDREYLDLLLQYNTEDIENLKFVADHLYRVNKEKMMEQMHHG